MTLLPNFEWRILLKHRANLYWEKYFHPMKIQVKGRQLMTEVPVELLCILPKLITPLI